MARENELDNLATPWVISCLANGVTSCTGTIRKDVANEPIDPEDVDEPVFAQYTLTIPPFQTVLVHG